MANNFNLSAAAANAAAVAVTQLLDAGPGNGYMEIRTGTQPASPDSAATGILLATLTFSKPAFASPTNGSIAANAITGDPAADADGTASWFRCYDSTGTAIFDGEIGLTGGEADDLEFSTVAFLTNGAINVSNFTYTQPMG